VRENIGVLRSTVQKNSIEFFNSMSIVRKKVTSSVALGSRFVSGHEFPLADNAPFNLGDALHNDRRGNPYADLDLISNKHVLGVLSGIFSHLDASKFEQAQIVERLGTIEDEVMQTARLQHAEILERLAAPADIFQMAARKAPTGAPLKVGMT